MIDLLSVKLNGEYDFIQNTVPAGSGRWLVSETFIDGVTYTKGESYQVDNGTPTQIETAMDYKINNCIYETIEKVFEWLNNYFYRRSDVIINNRYDYQCGYWGYNDLLSRYVSNYGEYTFASNSLTVTDNVFKTGDLVQVREAQRNRYMSYAVVSGDTITFDNPAFFDTTEKALLMLSQPPKSVEKIIASMIYFDVAVRDGYSDLNSENIGNYSYGKDMTPVGGLGYPSALVEDLKNHRQVRFSQ